MQAKKAIVSSTQNNFELEIVTLSRTSTLDDCSGRNPVRGWLLLAAVFIPAPRPLWPTYFPSSEKERAEVAVTFYRKISRGRTLVISGTETR